jgi:hypothetical protein
MTKRELDSIKRTKKDINVELKRLQKSLAPRLRRARELDENIAIEKRIEELNDLLKQYEGKINAYEEAQQKEALTVSAPPKESETLPEKEGEEPEEKSQYDIFTEPNRVITPPSENNEEGEFFFPKIEENIPSSESFAPPVFEEEEKTEAPEEDEDTLDAPSIHTTEAEDPEKVKVVMPPEYVAKQFIDTGNTLMSVILPLIYDYTIYSERERELMKLITKKPTEEHNQRDGSSVRTMTFTPEELAVEEKYKRVEEYKKGIPLTEQERQDILTPLIMVLKDKGVEVTPMGALIMVVFSVLMARSIPIVMEKGTTFIETIKTQ